MKAFFALIFCTFFGEFTASAQLAQTARAELPVLSNFSNFEVWPQPDSTVLVLNMEPYYRRNLKPFTFFRFDNNLNLQWQTQLEVPKGSQFLKAYFEKQ